MVAQLRACLCLTFWPGPGAQCLDSRYLFAYVAKRDRQDNQPCHPITTIPSSLQATDKQLQQRVAMALARLAKPTDLRECFVNRKGLEILLELLTDSRKEASVQKEAAGEYPHGSRLCKHPATLGGTCVAYPVAAILQP